MPRFVIEPTKPPIVISLKEDLGDGVSIMANGYYIATFMENGFLRLAGNLPQSDLPGMAITNAGKIAIEMDE